MDNKELIWIVSSYIKGEDWKLYVKATINQMRARLYSHDVMQFLAAPVYETTILPTSHEKEAGLALSAKQFDEFRKTIKNLGYEQ